MNYSKLSRPTWLKHLNQRTSKAKTTPSKPNPFKNSILNKVRLAIFLCFLSAIICSNYFISSSVIPLLKDAADESTVKSSREVIEKIQQELTIAKTLAFSLATIASNLPNDKQTLYQLLPNIISPEGSKNAVVGGGIWPEPYIFDKQLERSSLFWGKNTQGELVFFDDYNMNDVPSYHEEGWYVPVRKLSANQVHWSKSYNDPYSHQRMVTVSAPIWRGTEYIGVSTIDINLDRILNTINNGASLLGGHGFLVDNDGHFISPPNKAIKQSDIDLQNELSFSILRKNNERFMVSKKQQKTHKASLNTNGRRDNIEFFDVYNEASGEALRIILFHMNDTQWTLGFITPKNLFMTPVYAFVKKTLIVQALILIFFLLIIYFTLEKLIRKPFFKLLNQLENDNKFIKYPNKHDELSVFTTLFNKRYAQLKNSKKELRENSAYLQRALDSAHAGTLSFNAESQYLDWDEKSSQIFGVPHQEDSNKFEVLKQLIHPNDLDKIALFKGALDDPGITDYKTEYRICLPDKSLRWIQGSIKILRDDNGKAISCNGLHLDLTERKTTEASLLAKEMAEKSNRLKSEFLAHMSHELRTPMHGILSFADFGIKKSDTASREKLSQYFQYIQTSGQRLLGLLNDLLDLSKVEAGKMLLHKQRSDFNTIIDNCCREQQQKLIDANIDVQITKNKTSLHANIDALRITQVICNLLSNSIKFSPDNSIIYINTSQNDNEQLCFTMTNEGAPIPANELESIFDPFIQSQKPPTEHKGTGLGLAISREFIEAHNGKIWAEANKKKGATFKFLLPIK